MPRDTQSSAVGKSAAVHMCVTSLSRARATAELGRQTKKKRQQQQLMLLRISPHPRNQTSFRSSHALPSSPFAPSRVCARRPALLRSPPPSSPRGTAERGAVGFAPHYHRRRRRRPSEPSLPPETPREWPPRLPCLASCPAAEKASTYVDANARGNNQITDSGMFNGVRICAPVSVVLDGTKFKCLSGG